jgi:hypothetical protein
MAQELDSTGHSFLSQWFLPEHGLNAGTQWEKMPVGNMPYLMNWDDSLNKDVDDVCAAQVMATILLKKLPDGKWPQDKFVMDTPRNLSRAYERVLDPQYSSGYDGWLAARLRHDTLACLGAKIVAAVIAHGAPLSRASGDDRALPSGHRHTATRGEHTGKNGGVRTKTTLEKVLAQRKWLHPHTARGQAMRIAQSRERYESIVH